MNQILKSQQTPHTSPSRASYVQGVYREDLRKIIVLQRYHTVKCILLSLCRPSYAQRCAGSRTTKLAEIFGLHRTGSEPWRTLTRWLQSLCTLFYLPSYQLARSLDNNPSKMAHSVGWKPSENSWFEGTVGSVLKCNKIHQIVMTLSLLCLLWYWIWFFWQWDTKNTRQDILVWFGWRVNPGPLTRCL